MGGIEKTERTSLSVCVRCRNYRVETEDLRFVKNHFRGVVVEFSLRSVRMKITAEVPSSGSVNTEHNFHRLLFVILVDQSEMTGSDTGGFLLLSNPTLVIISKP